MRLTDTEDDLASRALSVLDQRLRTDTSAPLAVAFSGGGDSLALLLIAARWAKARNRRLLVLNVDHGLQDASAAWAQACTDRAATLGADFRGLAWTGPKPSSGVPAAARKARHALMAEAAREAGARVILMGHTADDVIEARRMRDTGSSTPEPRFWSPSPVWPQGRGLFLLRPLLAIRRKALRKWLRAQGETWIEDPANADPRYARVRARQSQAPTDMSPPTDHEGLAALARDVQPLAGGFLIERRALRRAEVADVRRLLGAAALCAGGADRPALRERLRALTERVRGEDDFTATLAGARIVAGGRHVEIFREAGEAARGGLAPLSLQPGLPAIWDGRFELTSDHPVEVTALRGHSRRLSAEQARALAALPAAARPALPLTGAGSPLLGALEGITCTALSHQRLLAACGVMDREPL